MEQGAVNSTEYENNYYIDTEEQRVLKELEETMDYARRKIDQISMGIVTEYAAGYYEDLYFESLNKHNNITGKPIKDRVALE